MLSEKLSSSEIEHSSLLFSLYNIGQYKEFLYKILGCFISVSIKTFINEILFLKEFKGCILQVISI